MGNDIYSQQNREFEFCLMAKIIKILCHGCGELFTAYGKHGKSKLSIRTIVDCKLHETKKKKKGK